jgi:hypothetical protein
MVGVGGVAATAVVVGGGCTVSAGVGAAGAVAAGGGGGTVATGAGVFAGGAAVIAVLVGAAALWGFSGRTTNISTATVAAAETSVAASRSQTRVPDSSLSSAGIAGAATGGATARASFSASSGPRPDWTESAMGWSAKPGSMTGLELGADGYAGLAGVSGAPTTGVTRDPYSSGGNEISVLRTEMTGPEFTGIKGSGALGAPFGLETGPYTRAFGFPRGADIGPGVDARAGGGAGFGSAPRFAPGGFAFLWVLGGASPRLGSACSDFTYRRVGVSGGASSSS